MNSFVIFEIFSRKIVFADPDAEEEELATALVVIATCDGELCLVKKPGGQSISIELFDECLKLALSREQSICKLTSTILTEKQNK